MPRMPVLTREEMTEEGKAVYDQAKATTGRVGRGPSIGYAHSPGLWKAANEEGAFFEHNCSLSPKQLRIAALVTARRWNADYPWSAQARMALEAGVDQAAVDAINAGKRPSLGDAEDEAVYAVAHELLQTGTLGDATFKQAQEALGYHKLADVVGVVGHFCKTAMMANVAGVVAPDDAPSKLQA